MFSRHVCDQLAAHIEGQLGAREARKVERHLSQCERCRTDRERVRLGKAVLHHLPLVAAPDGVWASIEGALPVLRSLGSQAIRRLRLMFAMLVLLALAAASYWTLGQRRGMRWDVVRIQGTPAVGAKA